MDHLTSAHIPVLMGMGMGTGGSWYGNLHGLAPWACVNVIPSPLSLLMVVVAMWSLLLSVCCFVLFNPYPQSTLQAVAHGHGEALCHSSLLWGAMAVNTWSTL